LIADFNDYQRLPRVLRDFAEKYRKAKKYEQAGDIYQQVAQHHPRPDSNGITRAQLDASRMDILSFMEWGDDPNAQAAIESLIADFNDYQRLPAVLRIFARKYRVAGKYDEAESIYETIATDFPDTNDALRAQMAASMMNILTFIDDGNDAAAMAAIDKLIADSNDHSNVPATLRRFARKYEGLKNYEGAQAVYQHIIQQFPDSPDANTAKLGISKLDIYLLIESGNDSNVPSAVDKLIADFNDHPGLPVAVFVIGEEYYYKAAEAGADPNSKAEAKAYYRKAKGVWERMITESADPNAEVTKDAYYFTGVCFRRMGEYGDAIFYYQEVVDNWPDYKYAWSAQCLIGECFERLQKSGALPEAEAEPLIEQAYKLVIENYPDSSLAGHACLKLAEMNLKKGRELEAAGYYELFLTSAPADPRVKSVKARLEKLGGQSK